MGTLGGMSDKPKGYGALDTAVSEIVGEILAASGRGLRDVAAEAGMSHNRLGKIKRLETPPPTIGELDRIANALGVTASELFRQAEQRIAMSDLDPSMYALAAREADDDDEAAAQEQSS